MNKRDKFIFIFIIALIDIILVRFSFLLSKKLIFELSPNLYLPFLEANFLVVRIYLFWILSSLIFNIYPKFFKGNILAFYRLSWRVFLLYFVFFTLYFLEKNGFKNSIHFLSINFAFTCFFIVIFRGSLLFIKSTYYKKKINKSKIGIIGFNKTGIDLARNFEEDFMAFSFEGILDEKNPFLKGDNTYRIKAIKQFIDDSKVKGISELYLCESPDLLPYLGEIFKSSEKNCIKLKYIPHIDLPTDEKMVVHRMDDHLMYTRWNQPLEKLSNRIIKRIFDIFFSLLVIVFILTWLYPVIAFLIKRQSPGPILFKQKRSGINNNDFTCLKFRSMRINKESDEKMAFLNDPRITPIGSFIRKTSIDELPQFFNVLKGEMTIVGPRPHMLAHTDHFNQKVDDFMVRHFIKPGITGLAQVSGYRGEISEKEWQARINFDLNYLENWSIFLDIKICFITLISIFKGDDKAY